MMVDIATREQTVIKQVTVVSSIKTPLNVDGIGTNALPLMFVEPNRFVGKYITSGKITM
tara:strand:+ start:3222 stop:3398 length:177 start_codon:yes stop_codon:yes gene_type:complete